MGNTLHITSGDSSGESLMKSGLDGEVFVWHDILYDGPRNPGWPDENTLNARAEFLEETTAGGLNRQSVIETLHTQYRKLASVPDKHILLWFDACLFDQSMLAHILTCLLHLNARWVELLCVDQFPGIKPYHGIGQLQPDQLASLYDSRTTVTDLQFKFAVQVDRAFATQNFAGLTQLSQEECLPLPWVPAAVDRWLQERPDPVTGLGRLETLALKAIQAGCETPGQIFKFVSAADMPPQYWGDITLWAKINGLAERKPPLVKIHGPADRLPQWGSNEGLKGFKIKPLPPHQPNTH